MFTRLAELLCETGDKTSHVPSSQASLNHKIQTTTKPFVRAMFLFEFIFTYTKSHNAKSFSYFTNSKEKSKSQISSQVWSKVLQHTQSLLLLRKTNAGLSSSAAFDFQDDFLMLDWVRWLILSRMKLLSFVLLKDIWHAEFVFNHGLSHHGIWFCNTLNKTTNICYCDVLSKFSSLNVYSKLCVSSTWYVALVLPSIFLLVFFHVVM